jgi:hypothetical protein
VPVVAVEDAIRAACSRWRVLEVAADPYRWQRSLEVLDGDGIPVHEFFQTAARMGPATARFYQLVVDQALAHDGDSRRARHVGNAILREDSRGARLSKETKDSPRRIDAAVAAVMAVHRAAELARGPGAQHLPLSTPRPRGASAYPPGVVAWAMLLPASPTRGPMGCPEDAWKAHPAHHPTKQRQQPG